MTGTSNQRLHTRRTILAATSAALVLLIGVNNHAAAQCQPTQQAKVVASDSSSGDELGRSVAVNAKGDRFVVGASFEWSAHGGGQAYIFDHDGTNWVEQAILVGPDTRFGDRFGTAVGMSNDGNVVAVGTPVHNGTGAAYIFRYDGAAWNLEAKVVGTGVVGGDNFGVSINVSGDGQTVLVGANYTESMRGHAYVFRFDGSGWVEYDDLLPADANAGQNFGSGVSLNLDGTIALVGSHRDDDNGGDSGSAYIFIDSGSGFVEDAKLLPTDGRAGAAFGYSVSMAGFGEKAVIGAGTDADVGAAYIFAAGEGPWTQEQKLVAPDGLRGDQFGVGVAIDHLADRVAIGAFLSDDPGDQCGTAYLFHFDPMTQTWVYDDEMQPDDAAADQRFGWSASLSDDGKFVCFGAYGDATNVWNAGAAYVFETGCAPVLDLALDQLIGGARTTFTIAGGAPGERGALVYGFKAGLTEINGYADYCATFGIEGVNQKRVIGGYRNTFDANGEISIEQFIPKSASGLEIHFQAAERGTCPSEHMSNVVIDTVQ